MTYCERSSFVKRRLERNTAAEHSAEMLTDGETEARASVSAGRRSIRLTEWLKDFFGLIRRRA